MKTIHYGPRAILTSDDVADAVIEYAAALSNGNRTDRVAIPSIAKDGTIARTTVLLGPATQIAVVDAADDELEREDPPFVARLQAAAATFPHADTIHAAELPASIETAP